MKILNGRELAGFVKERQAQMVRSREADFHTGRSHAPRLLIIRDSDDPVIVKYVQLKMRYGEDIGVRVEDYHAKTTAEIREKILAANKDAAVDGIIVQLPIAEKAATDELCNLIALEKDVDGLGINAKFDSATATAILWLLAGYDINLDGKKIAIVGRGKLVGAPLFRIFTKAGRQVKMFHRGDDLMQLLNYDIIITATGVPGLITSAMISGGAVVVDAGTASEKGKLVGDLAEEVYERTDLTAITPQIGGVGPLTVSCLFDHVLQSANI